MESLSSNPNPDTDTDTDTDTNPDPDTDPDMDVNFYLRFKNVLKVWEISTWNSKTRWKLQNKTDANILFQLDIQKMDLRFKKSHDHGEKKERLRVKKDLKRNPNPDPDINVSFYLRLKKNIVKNGNQWVITPNPDTKWCMLNCWIVGLLDCWF